MIGDGLFRMVQLVLRPTRMLATTTSRPPVRFLPDRLWHVSAVLPNDETKGTCR